jgi:hypothetical protein
LLDGFAAGQRQRRAHQAQGVALRGEVFADLLLQVRKGAAKRLCPSSTSSSAAGLPPSRVRASRSARLRGANKWRVKTTGKAWRTTIF